MFLSVVVPCFNEEEVLGETHERLTGLLCKWSASGLLDNYEIIFVDDGSTDATADLLCEMAGTDVRVKVLHLSRNNGHQNALIAGMRYAHGDAVVTIDADLQDPPEVIESMIHRYQEGFDIVYGVRKSRSKDSFFKKNTALAFYRIMRFMGVNIIHNHADFRLFSSDVNQGLRRYKERSLFLRGIFPLIGYRWCTVEYERRGRFAGETKYPLRKMIAFAVAGITSFSFFPLRIASVLGILVFVFCGALTVWALITHMMGRTILGWASTVIPIYFLGGVQLLCVGIIGEYIGKIYLETKRRPRYFIRETRNIAEHKSARECFPEED